MVVATGHAEDGLVADVVGALRAHGARAVVVESEGSPDREELAERLRSVLAGELGSGTAGVEGEQAGDELSEDDGGMVVGGVLSLLAAGGDGEPMLGGVAGTLVLAQALGDVGVAAPLWCVTQGGVAVGVGDRVLGPAAGLVWGLGRVVGLEEPGRWGGLVDLPERVDEGVLERLCGVLGAVDDEDEVAIRAGGVFARRLTRAPLGSGRAEPAYVPRGTVLVTGGTGAVGAHVARWLADAGAERLLLTSRRGLDAPGAVELVEELEARGARVNVLACDVADRARLGEVLASVPGECPLSAVFHVAGVADDDDAIDRLSVERLEGTLAAKAGGAWLLHKLTEGLELDAFVLFSSIAGTLGSGGQGAYAAGNAFLDALVEFRRGLGLAGSSIAWGAWAGEGMAASAGESLGRRGIRRMPVGLVVGALGGVLAADEGCVVVADLDWERYAPTYSSARARPLIGDLPEVQRALRETAGEQGKSEGGGLAERLAGVPAGERERVVLELVCEHAAAVLGHSSPEAVPAGRAFRELGFDSLAAVQLSRELRAATGLRLPTTVVFDYPTPAELAAHLLGEAAGERALVRVASPAASYVDEPIAIVGMSCGYPGPARSPQELWELLAAGGDAIGGFPPDRGWDLAGLYDPDPERQGKSYAREGGFLYDAGEFDAAFFGISPREALAMDPQQRLLLEACWEAVEHAGIDLSTLKGSQTGVFAGVSPSGYGGLQASLAEPGTEGYWLTGASGSVVSGRVAYTFGLEGPAVTVDTACSSSLVALHMACGALRGGECTMALAGGVAVLATPDVFVEFSRQRGLAPDGRCKPFADAADGTGWGEGVGVLLLERLSDARDNGHPVLAVIRGSALNQDGASNGLSAPNGPSQQRVIMQALANAGLQPRDVDVVEAHGTGTTLGDPIEAQALIATYGQERERPLWLGSVKSNLGHTQTAAGVAGVIKMVMALQHELLPRTLHVDEPSAQVDWSAGRVALLVEEVPWRRGETPRRAGVSAFGISGTNAHVILEEAPPQATLERESRGRPAHGVVPWVVSGRGDDGLRAQAARLHNFLAGAGKLDAADVARSLAARTPLEQRAVLVGDTREQLIDGLAALARGGSEGSVLAATPPTRVVDGRTAFLFTGQGAQRVGMGRELYGLFPGFAAAFDEVCAHFDLELGCSLREVVFGGESAGGGVLDGTAFAQPALFALEVALFRLVWEWGVRPDFVIGHSVGELVAAHVAGVFSLEDACRLVAARGRLMGALPGGGAMAAIAASEEEMSESLAALAGWEGRVALAAVNAPGSVVVSGDEDAVVELVGVWEGRGRRTRRLRVSHAFHSPRMEGMLEEFREVAEGVSFNEPRIPLVSNLSGGLAGGELCTAEYWVRHVRETVRFADGVRWLRGEGVGSFLELGPDGILSAMVAECVEDGGDRVHAAATAEPDGGQEARGGVDPGDDVGVDPGDGAGVVAVSLLRSGLAEGRSAFAGLGEVWVRGVGVDWGRVFEGSGARRVELPSYAFQRERYWLQAERPALYGGDAWRYRVQWTPVGERAAGVLAGTWPVLVPAGRSAERAIAEIVGALAARGARPRVVEVDGAGMDREQLASRLRALTVEGDGATGELVADREGVSVGGVLSLLALAGEEGGALEGGKGGALEGGEAGLEGGDAGRGRVEPAAGVIGLLALTQALGDVGIDAPLWCLTSGAVSVGAGDRVSRPAQAMVWGLGRVVGLEHPGRWGGLVDLPGELDERTLGRLCDVLGGWGGEDEVAVRAGGVFARRLARAPRYERRARGAYRPRGTALVTGGTGALGAHVARWLAGEGAEHVMLTSRRGLQAPGAAELVEELEGMGARVSVVACDVADRAQLRQALDSVPGECPLSAVFHMAGALHDDALAELSAEQLAEVLAGKAGGAWLLHELTEGLELDAFVLFSSIAGTLGSGGQGAYAAGNAFLDALAELRRGRGLVATSVAWGAWAGEGMAVGGGEFLDRRGIRSMPPESAIGALRDVLEGDEGCVVVADLDWERYALTYSSARERPLIGDLPEVQRALREAVVEVAGAEVGGGLAARLDGVPESERERVVVGLVREHAAAALGHSSVEGVQAERPFKELGLDSLAGVQLARALRAATGLALPATAVFDHPTAVELAGHLLRELAGERAVVRVLAQAGVDEPVAIVGIGCRYPGPTRPVRSAGELWELLAAGGDAIGGFPADRGWDLEGLYDPDPDRVGTSYAREGGFLYDAGEFDAGFFGIGPREALAMDPQQRLLLEVCWEALEHAGVDPLSLRESATGVFTGVSASGYVGAAAGEGLEGYRLTGNHASVVSGRIAYTFGLEGPAVSVDTACSSSLVALHLASQSLRGGECSLALAGGITVMAAPDAFVEFARQRGLAPDGRCKSFGDAADGTGWGEGVGVLLLERLSDAERNGHRVLGVLRGSAVNQDGASNGLTAPNGPAQQRVILQALANAGLAPGDVDAVEGHGTGTTLGDPIEAQALLATYGQGRQGDPLWLGSVKSNIGHTAAAAGVAGVIKMVMALRHGRLPRTLHAERPSSQVDWSAGAVALLSEERPWPANGKPRRAGISAFGVSGTNAHVIVEEPPARAPMLTSGPASDTDSQIVPWVLSGRGSAGLRSQAGRLRQFLVQSPELQAPDVAFSLTVRAALENRAVVVERDRAELLESLAALARGERGDVAGRRVTARGGLAGEGGGLAFLFTGQGAQRVGMGRELYGLFGVFAAAFDEACTHLDRGLGCSLREMVFGEAPAGGGLEAPRSEGASTSAETASGAGGLDQTAFAQPALFALEVALFRLVEAWGVRPDFVIGHSVGELAAAHVAGVFSLEDACALVAARARSMGALPGGGAMAAIAASEEEVVESLAALADWEGRVALAAVNAPGSVVVSGDEDAVAELVGVWEGRGRRTRRLRVSHAFHSPRMEGMLQEFREVAEGVSFNEPRIPLVSNLSGGLAGGELCTVEYWVRHVRETVRFADGVRWLRGEGVRSFLELGPDGILSAMVAECVEGGDDREHAAGTAAPDGVEAARGGADPGDGAGVVAVSLLRSGLAEGRSVFAGLGEVWVRGVGVDWGRVFEGSGARRVELPSYAFQRERYWLQAEPAAVPGGTSGGWRYRVRWRHVGERGVGVLAGVWPVVARAGHVDDRLIAGVEAALRARGGRAVVVEVGEGELQREPLAVRLRALLAGELAHDGLSANADGVSADGVVVGGVLSLLALGEAGGPQVGAQPMPGVAGTPAQAPGEAGGLPAGVLTPGVLGTLALAQALGDADVGAPLWCVTRGAVSVGAEDPVVDPAGGLVWGLGRVMALEEPGRWGGLVDLPAEPDEAALERMCGALADLDGEDEVAVRSGRMFARRLARASLREQRAVREYRPEGTVLVTGGTGALGAHVARWLAGAGAEHILLSSRRGLAAPGAVELARELESSGATVSVVACDVADREQLEGLLAGIPTEQPLSGVFHVAGVLDDGLLDGLTPERLEAVLRAKADAAWLLHELTEGVELSAFVLFSALAGTLGSGGQGAYAAGNAFLDALAEYRRAQGLPATAIAWGAWAGEGMAAAAAERLQRGGIGGLAPELAVGALQQALEDDETHIVLADVSWERYAAAHAPVLRRPLIGDLPEVQWALRACVDEEQRAGMAEGSLASSLAAVPSEEREQVVLDLVRAQVAAVLGHASPEGVQVERAFKELGLDSLAGVELRNRLAALSGLQLPTTLAFDYPTPRALASHLLGEVAGTGVGGATGTRGGGATGTRAVRIDEPVAIVGMSCRYPGGGHPVGSPGELWELIASGADAVGRFPTDRGWDLEELYDPDAQRPGTSYVREGGFLHEAGEFDASFFGIGPREALAMSPQQRLLLEVCWEAFENAGVTPAALRGTPTGVFAGINLSDYGIGPLGEEARDLEGYIGTGGAPSVVSGRVAYTFGLEGPAVTVDTACSSSLVALHLACQALRCGECSLALAGGVTVMATPVIFVEFSRQQALAPDGRCKPFADAADGTGFSEGAGVVLLERLSDALRNGHRILAVVRGSAVNQDGASNGLTAPNGPSQQRVIQQALANAGLSPAQIDAVEAHGTGTTLGDPIEAQALIATYGQDRPRDRPLWLGSVKSNIGHTQAASGVAGVIKMAMALRHGVLPRTLHVDRPSERIDWAGGAVLLLTEEVAWPRAGEPRRAGVSSFGVSGTNAHVIIEEAPHARSAGEPQEASSHAGEPDGASSHAGEPDGASSSHIPAPPSEGSRA